MIRKRILTYQPLENRCLLAGDLLLGSASPWTNPVQPTDVNADGAVTPRDALAIINQLNRGGGGSLADRVAPPILGDDALTTDPPAFYDPTGDGEVTPRDALRIINQLNAGSSNAAAAGEPIDQDHADVRDAATPIMLVDNFGRSTGTLNSATDVDQFQFDPDRLGVVVSVVDTAGNPLDFMLTDAAGGTLGTVDRSRTGFQGILLARSAEDVVFVRIASGDNPGVVGTDYVLSVYQYNPSRFRLSGTLPIAEAIGQDISDFRESARDIDVDPNSGAEFIATIQSPSDVDVYRLPRYMSGSMLVRGFEGIRLTLTDSAGVPIEKQPTTLQPRSDSELGIYDLGRPIDPDAADAVFVQIASSGDVGDYELAILLSGQSAPLPADFQRGFPERPPTPPPTPNPPGGGDVVGDTRETATNLTTLENQSRAFQLVRIDSQTDIDVYRFVPSAETLNLLLVSFGDLPQKGIFKFRVTDDQGNDIPRGPIGPTQLSQYFEDPDRYEIAGYVVTPGEPVFIEIGSDISGRVTGGRVTGGLVVESHEPSLLAV